MGTHADYHKNTQHTQACMLLERNGILPEVASYHHLKACPWHSKRLILCSLSRHPQLDAFLPSINLEKGKKMNIKCSNIQKTEETQVLNKKMHTKVKGTTRQKKEEMYAEQ